MTKGKQRKIKEKVLASAYARAVLKRIREEYWPVLKFLSKPREQGIGFWTSIRMVMPLVEACEKIEDLDSEQMLDKLGVPNPDIVWPMFRHGLAHSEMPFRIESGEATYSWAISLDDVRHASRKHGEKNYLILISVPRLLKQIENYLQRFIESEFLIEIQIGKVIG